MESFWKWLVSASISVSLVIPLAPVLYAVVGGGVIGSLACLGLGTVTYWAVSTVVRSVVEGYRWVRDRRKPVEDTRLRVPQHTVYEIDWTKITKDDNM